MDGLKFLCLYIIKYILNIYGWFLNGWFNLVIFLKGWYKREYYNIIVLFLVFNLK